MLSKSQRKWIHAQLYLCWVGFWHCVRRVLPWFFQSTGLEQFRANYIAEGHLPISSSLRSIAHEPGRCTTCGLCDASCPKGLSPMRMLLQNKAPTSDCLDCLICESACPENIPIIAYTQEASKTFHSGASWSKN